MTIEPTEQLWLLQTRVSSPFTDWFVHFQAFSLSVATQTSTYFVDHTQEAVRV